MRKFLLLLCTAFLISCQKSEIVKDRLSISQNLEGKWIAPAWTGELHEEWKVGEDGWMLQQGHYIENGDTSFSANTKIEVVKDELILFSVIKNSNPKIFKGSSIQPQGFVVRNEEYKNPFQVEYRFIDGQNYQRTITGFEQDSLVSTVFNFNKILE